MARALSIAEIVERCAKALKGRKRPITYEQLARLAGLPLAEVVYVAIGCPGSRTPAILDMVEGILDEE